MAEGFATLPNTPYGGVDNRMLQLYNKGNLAPNGPISTHIVHPEGFQGQPSPSPKPGADMMDVATYAAVPKPSSAVTSNLRPLGSFNAESIKENMVNIPGPPAPTGLNPLKWTGGANAMMQPMILKEAEEARRKKILAYQNKPREQATLMESL
jgi:hypothetical protein